MQGHGSHPPPTPRLIRNPIETKAAAVFGRLRQQMNPKPTTPLPQQKRQRSASWAKDHRRNHHQSTPRSTPRRRSNGFAPIPTEEEEEEEEEEAVQSQPTPAPATPAARRRQGADWASVKQRLQTIRTSVGGWACWQQNSRGKLRKAVRAEKAKERNSCWVDSRHSTVAQHMELVAVPRVPVTCMHCKDENATLKCDTCRAGGLYLCCTCDLHVYHSIAHAHKRFIWSSGFWEPVPPDAILDSNGQISNTRSNLIVPCMVSTCKGCNCGSKQGVWERADNWKDGRHSPLNLRIISEEGVNDFAVGVCTCKTCNKPQCQSTLDFMAAGLWPVDPPNKEPHLTVTVVSKSTLELQAAFEDNNPGCSEIGFWKSMERVHHCICCNITDFFC